jgi:XTP/dITP diphosphohydrolase
MTIYFATGNAGKLTTATQHLEPFSIKVQQAKLDIIEPQADTVEEIAISKAQQAFDKLGKPVMVEDGSFHITELNGFPGPYIKYVLQTISAEGILHLARDLTSRECYFTSTLAYADEQGNIQTFTKSGATGALATTVAPDNEGAAWSAVWRIFIPAGGTQALSNLPKAERDRLWHQWEKESTFSDLGHWLKRSK